MSTMTEQSWARDLLTRMHLPVTHNNMVTVLAWEYAEGGHFHNGAKYNPLNTTRDHAKFGSINSVGVATYPNYKTGMEQTIATLDLPAYKKVREDLAHDASPSRTAGAISASPWGTWHGVSAAPALARASKAVKAHPTWVKKGHRVPSKTHAKHGKGAGNKIVLDLAELERLSRVYRHGSDGVVGHRRAVSDIAVGIEPARKALADPGLATSLQTALNWVLEPGGGFDRDARLMDELSAYAADVHRLASEADKNHNGKWGRGEAMAFAAKHAGEQGAALDAVMAALARGTIVKKSPKGAGGGKGSGGTGTGTGGGSGHGGRQQKIDKMLAFANKQHANDGGNNHTKYGAWYGTNGVSWCAQFVSYVYAHSGNQLPSIDGTKGKGFQYCPDAINYARAHHQLHNTPHQGDIFLRKDGQHTGIVSKVHANGTFDTIEGNAGPNTDRVVHGERNSHDGLYYFWTAIK